MRTEAMKTENAAADYEANPHAKLTVVSKDNNLPEGFSPERATRYNAASKAAPKAREAELVKVRAALDSLKIKNSAKMVELGSGQGFGTALLLDYLAPDGTIIGVDASSYMVDKIASNPRIKLHVGALDQLEIESGSVDFAFSLAAFHHIPNKFIVVQELCRILKPGAHFLIVDANHGTEAQETFDYIVRPHCTTGHDADFLDSAWAKLIAERAGMEHISSTVEPADWEFDNEEAMLAYICDLFCLQLTPEEAKPLVDKWVKPYMDHKRNKCIFPWSLGFHVMRKPAGLPIK